MSDDFSTDLTEAFERSLQQAAEAAIRPIHKELDRLIFELEDEGVIITNLVMGMGTYCYDVNGPVYVEVVNGEEHRTPWEDGLWWSDFFSSNKTARENQRHGIEGLSERAEELGVKMDNLLCWIMNETYAPEYVLRQRSPFREPFKVRVTSKEHSRAIQEQLFKVGYGWHNIGNPSQEVEWNDHDYALYFSTANSSKLITCSSIFCDTPQFEDKQGASYFENHSNKETTLEEIEEKVSAFLERFPDFAS